MKPGIYAGLLTGLMLTTAGWCKAATWPSSCGAQTVNFKVHTEKKQPKPVAPPAGKATIVFLENENQMVGPFMHATVRFGVDGAWVGATNGTSYFSVDVAPGVHHLCANWQSDLHKNKNIDLTSFTATPGKVYYFSAHVTVESKYDVEFGIQRLNTDMAHYRISTSKFARSRAK